MASQAQTWNVLRRVQARIQETVLVTPSDGGAAVSPFALFNPKDADRYGTNPFLPITNAIFIGSPKPLNPAYTRQCHILPPLQEHVYRRAFGGKVWDEQWLYVVYLFRNDQDWWQTTQDLIAARDVTHAVIGKYAELPGVETVEASMGMAHGSGMPTGFFRDQRIGLEWDCWGFIWWYKQEYNVGPIVP